MYPLYPDNDLILEFSLLAPNPTGGGTEPVTTGTVTAFLSITKETNAVPADSALQVTCTHISNGRWRAHWDGAVLTRTLLDSKFAATTPYAHCKSTGDVSRYVELEYLTSAPAVVT